jgi:hypothetical protein
MTILPKVKQLTERDFSGMIMSLTSPTLAAPTAQQYQYGRLVPSPLAAAAPDQKPSLA